MEPIKRFQLLIILLVTAGGIAGCSLIERPQGSPLLHRMAASHTGVHFSNRIDYDEEFNILTYPYIYNGGGVAVGDLNNDGLPDLYFTGNMVSSRLYLNQGNFQFRDFTARSGTGTDRWAGGVSMVDINRDGFLDLYVSVSGPESSKPEERANLLFVNNGDSTFTESAARFGLADTGYTTHSAFFDYDRDGDLDLYLMNNFPGTFSRDSKIRIRPEVNDGSSKSADALYRNNGDGTFSEVSKKAGILKEGFSLGVAVSDFNRDGWPDLFISNDVQTDDLLYINNGDGTFTDKAAEYFKHTSYAGMGTDAADFNNDGWPDLLQVDMMPSALKEQQQVTGSMGYDLQRDLVRQGYQYQFQLNTLQLSNGRDARGNILFSEIGQLAGIAHTGWSWSGLFGDYDNDGWKDILITNGYPKRANSHDYMIQLNRSTMFGTDSTRKERRYEIMDEMKSLELTNHFYKNNGDLTFSDVSAEWGFDRPSLGYGAAHADLDNDGDLDIAINNIDGPAGIYENKTDSLKENRYLVIELKGDSLNPGAIGTRVVLTAGGKKQYAALWPWRGYQSTMDRKMIFGMGSEPAADSIEIFWPDGSYRLIENVETDRSLTVNYRASARPPSVTDTSHIFTDVTREVGIDYKHTENEYVDFNREPLLPHMLSRLGPPLAAGDLNDDHREDFYVGGAAGSPGVFFFQQADGTFKRSKETEPWNSDRFYEDTGAAIFDANGDDLMDLYVVSGGYATSPAATQLQDRLYLNTGKGRFIKANDRLPQMYTSGSVVKPGDYDRDGDTDLFVGGRLVPGQYPLPARSYILRNDGGSFTDVTNEVSPDLVEPGQITDAEWIDFNRDGLLDLATSGFWMPVRIFRQENGTFDDVTPSTGLAEKVGWWNSLTKGDLDGDGDMDLVAGNVGLNYKHSMPGSSPLHIFAGRFDRNQSLDAIMARSVDGAYYPVHGMRYMAEQLPVYMQRIPSYRAYANAELQKMLGGASLEDALHYEASYFSSAVLLNQGDGSFMVRSLPNAAQIAPVNDILLQDINQDNRLDLVTAGNMYETIPRVPRMDAGNGLLLLGDGEGSFSAVSPFKSAFQRSEKCTFERGYR